MGIQVIACGILIWERCDGCLCMSRCYIEIEILSAQFYDLSLTFREYIGTLRQSTRGMKRDYYYR